MTGRVLDIETQAPVLAYIRQGNNALAMTNDAGEFSADVAVPARLLITGVGYKSLTLDAYADDDQGNIYLEPEVTTLDPVVIEVEGPKPAFNPLWLVGLALVVYLASEGQKPRRRR